MSRKRASLLAGSVAVILGAVLVSQMGPVGAAVQPGARVPVQAQAAAVGAAKVDTSGPYGSMRRTGSNAVALTFDDGPDPLVTPKLLDLLKKQKVKATFCVTGWRARDNPDIIRRIAAEGHTLCNHSWQHLENLGKLDEAAIRKDLKATTKRIQQAVPGVPVQYFRAPYGNFTTRLNKIARELGMTPLSWSVDDQSWSSKKYGKGSKMVAHIVTVVQKNTRKGSVVLSHEMAKPWTVTAYKKLLPWLKARYKLIPLPVKKVPVPTPKPTATVKPPTSPATSPPPSVPPVPTVPVSPAPTATPTTASPTEPAATPTDDSPPVVTEPPASDIG